MNDLNSWIVPLSFICLVFCAFVFVVSLTIGKVNGVKDMRAEAVRIGYATWDGEREKEGRISFRWLKIEEVQTRKSK